MGYAYPTCGTVCVLYGDTKNNPSVTLQYDELNVLFVIAFGYNVIWMGRYLDNSVETIRERKMFLSHLVLFSISLVLAVCSHIFTSSLAEYGPWIQVCNIKAVNKPWIHVCSKFQRMHDVLFTLWALSTLKNRTLIASSESNRAFVLYGI